MTSTTINKNLELGFDLFSDKERLDAEELILSHLIQNPGTILEISQYLPVKCFTLTAHFVAYDALVEMAKSDSPIDPIQLEIYLDRHNKLNIVGGATGIAMWAGGSIMAPTPTIASIDKAIDYLVEIYKRKILLADLKKLQAKLIDLSIPYAEITANADRYLTEFLKDIKQKTAGLEPIKSTISTSLEKVIERLMQKTAGIDPISISSGFLDIDKLTGGFHPGNLIIIAGRPAMGKSAIAQNICLKISQKLPVAFFSLEMSTQQLNERFLAMKSGIAATKLRDGDLELTEIDRLLVAAEQLKQLNYWGNDNFNPTADFILSQCRQLAAKHGKLGAIAIDHIGLMVRDDDNAKNEISKITRKFKQMAMELDCPVFGLSQLNRGVEGRNDKRPQMSDLRDSGSLEQDADVVAMLYRDEYYNADTVDRGIAEVLFRKHRSGETGVVKLVFDGATTRFKNYARF